MKTGTFAVIVQNQGSKPKLAIVGSGATVRSALKASKINESDVAGRVTLGNKKVADFGTRLHQGDLLVISEPVTGGSL